MSDGFQLSPRQKHLWLLQPGDQEPVFYLKGTLSITGDLDVSALQDALATTTAKYEILRTLFVCPPALSIPVQVIRSAEQEQLPLHDLSKLDTAAQGEKADQLFTAHVQEGGVDREPTMVAALFRLGPTEHELRLWLPALSLDTTSFIRLTEQLAAAYKEQGAADKDDEEILQYADFAEWQHELLADEDAQAESEEWYRQLLAAPLDIHLPLEANPADEEIFTLAVLDRPVGSDLTSALAAIAETNDVSLATVLLAAWRILLWHLGQTELVLGLGCDGRTYEELEDALGLFATTLPLPSKLDGRESLSSLLSTLEDTVVAAYDRQEYFAWETLPQIGADDPRRHYFPIAFNYEIWPGSFLAGKTTFHIQSLFACTNRFHLLLDCHRQDDLLHLGFRYDSQRFLEAEIVRMADRLETLLADMAARPEATVGVYDILPGSEKEQILVSFNETKTTLPGTDLVHQLIASQASSRPKKPAVVFGEQQLTYSELNCRASHLASHLRLLGVGPNVPVGVLLNASLEAVVGILAVLKAGGAYVPLDPQYPLERVAFVLADARAPVLITETGLQQDLNTDHAEHIVLLDDLLRDPVSEVAPPVDVSIAGNDLAYLIYTSGSTGTPKGVAVTHANLYHTTAARSSFYEAAPERFLLLSSFAYDSSVAGLFWTLSQGGTLVLAAADDIRDPRALAELFAERTITHTLALPSLYQLLLSEAEAHQLETLQTVIVAGETCPRSLLDLHRERLPQTSLFNEYGPTEGTVWCAAFDCSTACVGSNVPIGRPIPDTKIYILTSDQRPAPIGVPGELYIGGPGVAKGYHDRPDLTVERFVPSPFSTFDALYRTGDLARFLPDGNIEFLGRADQQVKVRGYRVELEEVEAVLAAAPGVREVVVVAHENGQGLIQLVAYLTTFPERQTTLQALREHLERRLPPYMIPTTFVTLDRLPRMPNGKVNRKALPEPDGSERRAAGAYVAPRTALETVLAGIWSDLLEYEPAGTHDHFFNLGGHSILVTQLVARLRSLLPVDVPLRIVFDKPTIAELAAHLSAQSSNPDDLETAAELLVQVAGLSDAEAEAALTD